MKVAFRSPDSAIENMWVKVVAAEGDNLVGTLTNRPLSIEGLHCGDRVVVTREQIEKVQKVR